MFKKRNSTKASKHMPDGASILKNEFQVEKDSSNSKCKKSQKRQKALNEDDNDLSAFIAHCKKSNIKKFKSEACMEPCGEPHQKLMEAMSYQFDARKQCDDNLLQTLSEIISQLEEEDNSIIENKQMLEHLSGTIIKYMQQSTTALKQKIKTLKEIQDSFKRKCEDTDNDNRIKTEQLSDELEKLREKLHYETKRSGWETLRRTIFDAIQIDDF